MSDHKKSRGLSPGDDDYNSHLLQEIEQLEEESFWYKGRKELIVWAIQYYFRDAKLLVEIGSGTGFVLGEIRKTLPTLKVIAGDVSLAGLSYVRKRAPGVVLCQFDIRHIPCKNTLPLLCAFDVLEHIREDDVAFAQMFEAMQSDGGIILTVPQHPFLWSAMDEISQHKRRYIRKELVGKLENAGFSIIRVTSFGTLVFPLKLAEVFIRFVKKTLGIKDDHIHIVRPPTLVNNMIYVLMSIERFLIRHHISFPFGSSLLVLAKKDGDI